MFEMCRCLPESEHRKVAPLDPWIAMSAATARARLDGRGPWHAEQALTRQEALTASTRGRGRLRVGDPADIAVLDGDH